MLFSNNVPWRSLSQSSGKSAVILFRRQMLWSLWIGLNSSTHNWKHGLNTHTHTHTHQISEAPCFVWVNCNRLLISPWRLWELSSHPRNRLVLGMNMRGCCHFLLTICGWRSSWCKPLRLEDSKTGLNSFFILAFFSRLLRCSRWWMEKTCKMLSKLLTSTYYTFIKSVQENVYMWPWTTKPVLNRWGMFVATAKNTLYGSKLFIFLLCQKSLG